MLEVAAGILHRFPLTEDRYEVPWTVGNRPPRREFEEGVSKFLEDTNNLAVGPTIDRSFEKSRIATEGAQIVDSLATIPREIGIPGHMIVSLVTARLVVGANDKNLSPGFEEPIDGTQNGGGVLDMLQYIPERDGIE